MSAEGSSGARKRSRLRQYLSSRLGSSSPSNASVSSANEGGALTPPGPSLPAQTVGQGPQDNLKTGQRDRLFRVFSKSASDRPPNSRPFKRSTLEKDLAVLSTTYLMEDCPSLKELILSIVTLSAKCKNEKVGSLVLDRLRSWFLIIYSRAPYSPPNALISAFV